MKQKGGSTLDDSDPLRIPCPTCGATIGKPCRARWSDGSLTSPHGARLDPEIVAILSTV